MKLQLLLISVLMSCASMMQAQSATEPQVVFSEGFDAFTEGTEAEPAATDIAMTPSSYSSTLYQTIGWKGKYVYQAGQMLKVGESGNLQTKSYDMSAAGGTVKVSFRVRSLASYGGIVKCALGYSTTEQIILEDGDWHDVTVIFSNATSSSYLKFDPYLMSDGFLIDDIKAETDASFVKPTTANQPTVATATSFTASWSRITGATAYLLDVYTKTADGAVADYLLKDESVTLNSKSVTGLTEGKTYYYRVRVQKGEYTSDYSNEIEVVEVVESVPAPTVLDATNVSATGFTANWEAYAKAASYNVIVYGTSKFKADTKVKCLEEGFDGVTAGSTMYPEIGASSESLDKYTSTPGWGAVLDLYAPGMIGLQGFGSTEAYLESPVLDLSVDGGKFTVTANIGDILYGSFASGTTVTVKLLDVTSGEELESKTIVTESGFKDYVLEFTKGASDCYLEFSMLSSNKIMFDKITVEQNYKAGESFTALVANKTAETNMLNYETDMNAGVQYSYGVQSNVRTVVSGEIDYLSSAVSELKVVDYVPAAISGVLAGNESRVYSSAGSLVVELGEASPVSVYDLSGRLISTVNCQAGTTTLQVQSNMVIVKVKNGKSYKVGL